MKNRISYNKFVRNTILLSISIVLALFIIFGLYFKSVSIDKSIKNDTQIMADLIFQNLYTVMKNGGDKQNLDETIKHLQKTVPHIKIEILKEENHLSNEHVDSSIFKFKEAIINKHDKHLDFSSPILFKAECIRCHSDSKVNDIAGIVHIEHPILDLKISLKDILIMAGILLLIIVVVFFSTLYHYLNKYFVEPILNLAHQVKSTSSHHDLNTQISIETKIKELKLLEESFNKQNKELVESYQTIVSQSNTDSLTKIFNRKKFDEYSYLFFTDAKRNNHNFSLVLIDLNKFKPINDTYGHDVGDKVLIFFTRLISENIRETDFFFRIGGDEFILLLPENDKTNTQIVIEKIKENLKSNLFIFKDIKIELSASFGVCQFNESFENINNMMKIADTNMYQDKKNYLRSR